jgi:hypothetical protein
MKLLKDKVMVFCFVWGIILYLIGYFSSHFYFFSLGLLPFAVYEGFRTEGEHNTKPLSFLTSLVLILQFLHTAKIFLFPFDIKPFLELLPVTIPSTLDPFLFLSVAILIIFSFLLIRYTWGSVTKFLAIALLVGALFQAWLFLPEIKIMLGSPEGQNLLKGAKEEIRDNLYYRLRRELY